MMVNVTYKWTELEHLKGTQGFEELEKQLTNYMKANNFRLEEIYYTFSLLDHFHSMHKCAEQFFNQVDFDHAKFQDYLQNKSSNGN
jgi:hypothetical protein